jgi:hypothetical protein
MVACPVRRFTPELIRVYERRILKKLAWGTFDEIHSLENSPNIPACLKLFARALLRDLETGRLDTLNHPEFRYCKTVGELYADTVC